MSAPRAASKVLVIGSGGREHALALRLLASPSVSEVIVAPGNAGTEHVPEALAGKTLCNYSGDPVSIATDANVDLVVVGPEAPLCEGLADRLEAAGIAVFGPSRAAARLEGSKAFMKGFAARCGLRTARYEAVKTEEDAARAVASFDTPPVVKADGLCAGKGVVVAATHDEALEAARGMLRGERFGDAGRTVVIEERLEGAEASVHAVCDGRRALVLPSAQDHKRIFDGDRGPNTGGMGTYAPAPLVTGALAEQIRLEFMERAVQGMAELGTPYKGALFAGLMITSSGEPVLLEFNVRFGDPETQVLMNVLDGDFGALLVSCARGDLDPSVASVSSDHALCVVLAAEGYPGTPRAGDAITGLSDAARVPGVSVYHAGTRREGTEVRTAGGRVLGVTARGSSLSEAHERAYRAAELISFRGKQMRRDIGARALPGNR